MEDALREIVNMLKDIAPEVWRIALKQVDVLILRAFIGACVTSVLALLFGSGAWHSFRQFFKAEREDEDMYVAFSAICLISFIVFGMIAAFNWLDFVSYRLNPEWYAIQELLKLAQ